MRFFSMCYYIQPEVDILTRRNWLAMNCYSFLGHEYCSFFDAIVSHLIAVKLLRSQKFSDLLALESPPGLCLRSQPAKIITLQSLFSLIKLNLLPKNRHSLKCLNKFLNQGRKIATETNNWSINELAQDIKPYNV